MGCACASLSSFWLALQCIANMKASVPAIFPGPGARWGGGETRGLWLPSPRGAPGQPLAFFLPPGTGARSPAYPSSPHTPPSSVEGPGEVPLLAPGPLVLGSVGALSLGAPRPIRPDRPPRGTWAFPGDLKAGCSNARLHWGAFLCCWGHSRPSGMGYSLPVDLTVLPWMAASPASASGPPPHWLCPPQTSKGVHLRPVQLGPPWGRRVSAMHIALISFCFSSE